MGLVEDRARERGREKIAVLTEKGRDVAIKVREITMILEASDEPI
jgi:DNA-binding PadR family transcriptional regulator